MLPIVIALAASLTTGVAMTKPHTLDPAEYEKVIRVVVDATHAVKQCKTNTVDISALETDINTLIEYQSHLSTTDNSIRASKEALKLLIDFKYKHDYTVKYCQHKLSEIQAVSRTLARAMGGMSEYSICNSDVEDRYKLYEASYKSKLITKDEYEELVTDVVSMMRADKAGCSVETKVKMEQYLEVLTTAGSAASSL